MAANSKMSFPLDEPPTLPKKTYSGAPIKPRIVRAFAEQVDAEREANRALDHLIRILSLEDRRARQG